MRFLGPNVTQTRQVAGDTGVSLLFLFYWRIDQTISRFDLDGFWPLQGDQDHRMQHLPQSHHSYSRLHRNTDNTQLFNSSFPNFINGTDASEDVDAPWLGDFTISVFLKGLTVGQSTTGNAMGDTVLAFVGALPNGTDVLNDVLVSFLFSILVALQFWEMRVPSLST